MKKIMVFILSVLLFFSCSNLEEMNLDPNNPTQTHPKLLLTQLCMKAFTRGNSAMYATKMVIQADGENEGQYYKWSRGSFDPYNDLRNVQKMYEEAERINDPTYMALAKFFRAYYFYELTLRFGDIPYSEALKGESEAVYAPTYDAQEAVFEGLLNELKEANKLLTDNETIIGGDIIYQGNSFKWRKLINSFRLKVLMTLSNQSTVGQLNISSEFNSIASSQPLMESLADNGQLVYLDQQGNRYPQFNAQWSGYYMDDTFIQRLRERQDPRLFIFSAQTNQARTEGKAIDDFTSYEGGDPAAPYSDAIIKVSQGTISPINDRYRIDPIVEPTMLMGYAELQQILAEGVVRGWINGHAKTYYENGIRASFKFFETYAKKQAQYLNESALNSYLQGVLVDLDQATTAKQKIEYIIMQKYLVNFYQGNWDSYYEQLRTNYPEFRRPVGTNIPKRWMYPQSEYNVNGDHVKEALNRQFGVETENTHQTPWWIQTSK
ncbi:MAG: SusD/RagB family nutrient-binding outer membrane lipoprotein [Bacteroides sp.]